MQTFRENYKLKIFIQANCQSHALRAIFQRVKRLNNQYEIIDVKPVHLWQEEDYTEIIEKIKACDIFLHQPIFKQHFGEFASDNLKRYLNADAKAISFPNLYFTGYHPQAFYLKYTSGKKVSEPFDYHDTNIVEFYKQGVNEEEILKKIQDESFYSVREIEANIAESLKALRDREKHTDIKVSDYIEKNMIGKKLFHIFNHPSNEMLFYLFDEVLRYLDEDSLSEEEKSLFKIEMLGQVIYPVYLSVQKYFNINDKMYLLNYANEYNLIKMINMYLMIYKEKKI